MLHENVALELFRGGGDGLLLRQGLRHQTPPKDLLHHPSHLLLVGEGAVVLYGEQHWVAAERKTITLLKTANTITVLAVTKKKSSGGAGCSGPR